MLWTWALPSIVPVLVSWPFVDKGAPTTVIACRHDVDESRSVETGVQRLERLDDRHERHLGLVARDARGARARQHERVIGGIVEHVVLGSTPSSVKRPEPNGWSCIQTPLDQVCLQWGSCRTCSSPSSTAETAQTSGLGAVTGQSRGTHLHARRRQGAQTDDRDQQRGRQDVQIHAPHEPSRGAPGWRMGSAEVELLKSGLTITIRPSVTNRCDRDQGSLRHIPIRGDYGDSLGAGLDGLHFLRAPSGRSIPPPRSVYPARRAVQLSTVPALRSRGSLVGAAQPSDPRPADARGRSAPPCAVLSCDAPTRFRAATSMRATTIIEIMASIIVKPLKRESVEA
jgi:hypothetical protein